MDLILGAGVSGISYAGFTKNDYTIIEKEAEYGGYCRTIKRGDYVWDYSGHFFHFQSNDLKQRVCGNISKENLLSVRKKTQIYYKHSYIDFPFQKNIHQLEKEEFIDCLYDLFNAVDDGCYTSFKDMVIKKYGKSIADKFLVPYNEKLYACDIDKLDVNAMGRFFPVANRTEIISNFKNNNNHSYNDYFEYPIGGAIEYINSLLHYVDTNRLSLNEEVLSINTHDKLVKTNKRLIKYDNLISTIPFPNLLSKCNLNFDEKIFTSNRVLVFNIGFDSKGADSINSWIYFPEKDYVFYRIGYYDNIMGSDKMSLYVEIGIPNSQDVISFDSYFEKVIHDLKKCGIVDKQKVVDYEAVLMNPAYVHINKACIKEIQRLKEHLRLLNIYSIGRYGSWTYCSIEDNIKEAQYLSSILNK